MKERWEIKDRIWNMEYGIWNSGVGSWNMEIPINQLLTN